MRRGKHSREPRDPSLVRQAYRYELEPSTAQRVTMAKSAGTRRTAWNWALARRMELLKTHPRGDARRYSNAISDHKAWNACKREHFPWWNEVSKCAAQEAFHDLDAAFDGFRQAQRNCRLGIACRKVGFPKFKRRATDQARFRLTGAIHVREHAIALPRLGLVRTKERTGDKLRPNGEKRRDGFQGKILAATVSRVADRWFVSVLVDRKRTVPTLAPTGPVVGIDLGLNTFAVLSDRTGATVENLTAPLPLAAALKKLSRTQRRLARRATHAQAAHMKNSHPKRRDGTQNRRKAALVVARQHARIANIRRDHLHKLSHHLATTYRVVVFESLSVNWPLSNPTQARKTADSGLGELRRLTTYKCARHGSQCLLAHPQFPSTQRCSGGRDNSTGTDHSCGLGRSNVKTGDERLTLADRVYTCGHCGLVLDRDENAARNLAWYGEQMLLDPADADRTLPSDWEYPQARKTCLPSDTASAAMGSARAPSRSVRRRKPSATTQEDGVDDSDELPQQQAVS